MEQIDRLAIHGDLQGLGNRGGADAVQRCFFLVDDKARLLLVGLNIPIDIDNARRALEDLLHFLGELEARLIAGAVNLGDESLQDGRAGRHFGDGHARAVTLRDGRHSRTHALGDVVALRLALVLGDEIDLDVRHVCAAAHEVVAHQAVEIVGR
jgi:hypothetical protein